MKKIIKKFLSENCYCEDVNKVEHVLKTLWSMFGLQSEDDLDTLKQYIEEGKLTIEYDYDDTAFLKLRDEGKRYTGVALDFDEDGYKVNHYMSDYFKEKIKKISRLYKNLLKSKAKDYEVFDEEYFDAYNAILKCRNVFNKHLSKYDREINEIIEDILNDYENEISKVERDFIDEYLETRNEDKQEKEKK